MSNLSQTEIDALLDGLQSGGLLETLEPVEKEVALPTAPARQPSRNYRLYDFRRPEKLSKDHLRVMRSHFGLFWRKVANYLANLSRSSVDVALVEVDQTTYKDIYTSHGVPVVMCAFSPGDDLQGMMKLNLSQIFSLVDRLMGGTGNHNIKARALTEFERSLCHEVFENMLKFYAELRNQSPYPITTLETDERLMPRSLSGDEMMVRAIYDLRIGTSSGYLNLYLPLRSLTGLLGGSGSPQHDSKPMQTEVPKVVGRLPLEVQVVLGQSWMPASKVADLTPGTVLCLDQKEAAPLQVQVSGVPRFWARPGLRGNRLAVTLTGRHEGNG